MRQAHRTYTHICNKRELNSKVSYWENQKRKAEKQLQKLQAEIKELEKEVEWFERMDTMSPNGKIS